MALFLDGKTFGDDAMLIALGVTISGEKVVLGFVQTATENASVCAAFLRSLAERGLKHEQGLLVVMDGAKGLRKAVAGCNTTAACAFAGRNRPRCSKASCISDVRCFCSKRFWDSF